MILSAKPTQLPLKDKWKVHIDGALLGPNPSSIGSAGFTVWVDDLLYHAGTRQKIGATNNACEFFALLTALTWCKAHYLNNIDIYTDSQLVATWAEGRANLKEPGIKRLARDCHEMRSSVTFRVHWLKRGEEHQRFTDYIAKLGLLHDCTFSTARDLNLILAGYYQCD